MSEDTVEIQAENGSKVVIHLHGGTVISWVDQGQEVLFCSKDAIFNNKKAIRGGIPLVFPNFGPWSLGPQHGFARIKRWTLESQGKQDKDGQVSASLSLVDDEETRAMWNHKFKLLYTVTLGKDFLKLTLDVTNTGNESFEFTTLMHTYFKVDIEKTKLAGLGGLKYKDKVSPGDYTENRQLVQIDQEYDRIYQNVKDTVKILQEPAEKTSSIIVIRENLPDIVVWNPWIEKAKGMGDFGDEEYLNMVCVEAGAVSEPCSVDPDASLSFSQTINVVKAKSNV